MITIRVAIALLLMGALIAMLAATWVEMSLEQRLSASGLIFVGVLLLIGLEPWHRDRDG